MSRPRSSPSSTGRHAKAKRDSQTPESAPAPRDPEAPRRVSHEQLVEMLRNEEDCDGVIELTDDDADEASTTRASPSPSAVGATLRSAARTPSPVRYESRHVEIIGASGGAPRKGLEDMPGSDAPHPALGESIFEPDEDMVAASVREIVELREALGEKEIEVLSLRGELLEKERELALVRARRTIAPLSRLAQLEDPASSLGPRCLRFLAEALERSVSGGWRSAADFVRHFPPATVMRQLDHHPAVRASFLTLLVGIPERTALRTATEDAGRLLEAAVEEHDCEPGSFMRVFHRTAATGYLEPVQVWSFITGRDLVEVSRDPTTARYPIAQAHVAALLDLAIAQRLASPADVVDGITVEVLAASLAPGHLGATLRRILDAGRRGEAFADSDLLGSLPSKLLVDHVPLARVVEGVLLPLERRNELAPA